MLSEFVSLQKPVEYQLGLIWERTGSTFYQLSFSWVWLVTSDIQSRSPGKNVSWDYSNTISCQQTRPYSPQRRRGVAETPPSFPPLSCSVSAAALRKCCTATPLPKHCSHLLSSQLPCHVDFMVVFVPGCSQHLQARQVFSWCSCQAAMQINVLVCRFCVLRDEWLCVFVFHSVGVSQMWPWCKETWNRYWMSFSEN